MTIKGKNFNVKNGDARKSLVGATKTAADSSLCRKRQVSSDFLPSPEEVRPPSLLKHVHQHTKRSGKRTPQKKYKSRLRPEGSCVKVFKKLF